MKPSVLTTLFLFTVTGVSVGATKDSVVMIPSHGGSGSVIATGQGWTLILSCGHMFEDKKDLLHPITLEMPVPINGSPQKVGVRVVRVDLDSDLSLIQLNYGPVTYVSPVAPAGFSPGLCLSVGYDDMKKPGTWRPAEIVYSTTKYTFTKQRPWHGRSGGGLLDQRTGYLVGVVSGYQGPKNHLERFGNYKGVYASHQSILNFLSTSRVFKTDDIPQSQPSLPLPPQMQLPWAQPVPWTPHAQGGDC